MNGKRILCVAIGLATAPVALPASAQAQPVPAGPGHGLTELTDEEMGDMRGRYTVDSNTVAWFGVTMISTWQTQTGQQLQSSMTLAMDVSKPQVPKVTFQPHVSITPADAPPPAPSGQRAVDASGLANVTGVVQSVQVAGDGNTASNIAQVTVREHKQVPATAKAPDAAKAPKNASPAVAPAPGPAANLATASAPGMTATAQLQDNIARVLLQVDGQGAVEQWISRSGMGQTIQLAADGQRVSNRMELDLVRNAAHGSRAPLGQNVAQAIALSRGIAIGY